VTHQLAGGTADPHTPEHQRALQEARIHETLLHPNVVTTYLHEVQPLAWSQGLVRSLGVGWRGG
jgi:hypothetical protein